jgi:hypothetical protein
LVDLAIQKQDERSILLHAKNALGTLRQFRRDYLEYALHMKLGKWYETQGNLAEARDSWPSGYKGVKDNGDLGRLVSQETALSHLVALEEKLNNSGESKRYESILNSCFTVSESIARREVDNGNVR